MPSYDAIVVGSGPNGLSAAIEIARTGRRVLVRERAETIGGGAHSAELTLPGFIHDVFSAIHPLGAGSPFFRSLPLREHGLEWINPPTPLAHPFDDGTAAVLERSIAATGESLGRDADAYHALMAPLVAHWDELFRETLGPVLHIPRHPLLLIRFGLRALFPASRLARILFREEAARALIAGIAAHSMAPLGWPPTAAFGLILAIAGHAVGWPIPKGGSQQIANALASYFRSLGGEIETGAEVRSLRDLPPARAVLFDVTPKQLLRIAGDALPTSYRRRLRHFSYGPGIFKIDWALSGPIPWTAPECTRTTTVHLCGTLAELEASELDPWKGRHSERPFIILAQPSLFDPSRAPAGQHTAWAYCHVPAGSTMDMTERIEAQIERFAPGFRDLVLARSTLTTGELERMNPNLVGGSISGGANTPVQSLFRPVISLSPYSTPAREIFICSSSTPPGGAVHGMCGFHAARSALRSVLR